MNRNVMGTHYKLLVHSRSTKMMYEHYGRRISILLTSFIHMTTSMNLRKHFSFILFDSVNFSDLHGAFLYA